MSTVQLGSGVKRSATPARDELVFRSDIDSMITAGLTDLERRLQQFINARMPPPPKDPVVNVTVPTPNVKVDNAPATFAPKNETYNDITVEVTQLTAEMQALRADLRAAVELLSRPVTRTVQRDADGLILSVTETR